MARNCLTEGVSECPGAKCPGDRGSPDNPSSLSFVVPSLRAERCAGRPPSENSRASRSKENRHSQQRLLFYRLARSVVCRPVNRARHVIFGVFDHQTRMTFAHNTRTKGNTSSRSSQQTWNGLGMRGCLSKATRNSPSLQSSGAPGRGHSNSPRGEPSWSTLKERSGELRQTPSHGVRSQSCTRLHHEIQSRQGRSHTLGTRTRKAAQEEIASFRRTLHVHAGARKRRKSCEDGPSMAQKYIRWNLEEKRRGSRDGARNARSIRRVVEDQRYDQELLNQAVGVPWDEDGEGRVGEPSVILPAGVEARLVCDTPITPLEAAESRTLAHRRVYITNDALMKIGHTADCKACEGALRGKRASGVPRAPECSARLEADMAANEQHSDRLRQAEARLAGTAIPPVAPAKRKSSARG